MNLFCVDGSEICEKAFECKYQTIIVQLYFHFQKTYKLFMSLVNNVNLSHLI